MLDTLRTIISLSRYNIPRPGILFLLISYLKHTNGVDHDMELCACAVVDLCSQLISEQNVMSVSRDKHATRNQTQKQTPGFMDKGLLGDWNSNTLYVRMRNLYPSVPVIGILSVSNTAYRHQCFLPYKSAQPSILYRVLNGRRYQSQAASSSFHATDSYKRVEGG